MRYTKFEYGKTVEGVFVVEAELRNLIRQVKRQEKLEEMLRILRSQEKVFSEKEMQIQGICCKEQSDVEQLENRSIIAYFQSIAGNREKNPDKERREALEALAKYKLAETELADIRKNIRKYETELSALAGCKERYEEKLTKKREDLRKSGSESGKRLFDLEQRLAEIKSRQIELQEAMEAGNRTLATVGDVQESLNTAKGWGTYEMLGGSLIADVVKHSHMEKAQKQLERLQLQMGRFRTELADVHSLADLKVNIDGFDRYADIFLDNFFTDREIYERIRRSQQQVDEIGTNIACVIARLKEMKLSALEQENHILQEINHLAEQA